ncbi:MAG: hypothetical protein WDW38_008656 [Sanguina aurantia]
MGTPLLTGTQGALEYYVHACPTRIRSEMQTVFKGVDTSKLLIVPTCQHSEENLVQMGEKIEDEKDRLLIAFMEWAGGICRALEAQGHWSDYIDPCSGLPMLHTENQQVYSEVDGLSVLMGFQTANAGCCKVLLHPVWGTSVYPASMFTTAPLELLAKAIEDRLTAQPSADEVKA